MKLKRFLLLSGTCLFTLLVSFKAPVSLQKISLNMEIKSLHKNKLIITQAEVFYRSQGGLIVTHFIKPFENITIANSRGEMKIYDPKENTVMQMQSPNFSSQNSIFYAFFNNITQDMGLKKMGYALSKTEVEGKYLVTTWLLGTTNKSEIKKVELVLEKYSPIHMAFFNGKNEIKQKIYYGDYMQIEEFRLPLKITEINFNTKSDSIIERKIYTNVKTNADVVDTYLNYVIPMNAKVVDPYEESKKK
jgi:outer membrane lipoprotein-sorting protein